MVNSWYRGEHSGHWWNGETTGAFYCHLSNPISWPLTSHGAIGHWLYGRNDGALCCHQNHLPQWPFTITGASMVVDGELDESLEHYAVL